MAARKPRATAATNSLPAKSGQAVGGEADGAEQVGGLDDASADQLPGADTSGEVDGDKQDREGAEGAGVQTNPDPDHDQAEVGGFVPYRVTVRNGSNLEFVCRVCGGYIPPCGSWVKVISTEAEAKALAEAIEKFHAAPGLRGDVTIIAA